MQVYANACIGKIKQTVALAAAYGMNVTTPQADAIEAFGEIDA